MVYPIGTEHPGRKGWGLLRYWNIDASTHYHLSAAEYHLWLRNIVALIRKNKAVLNNVMITPGFNKEPQPI